MNIVKSVLPLLYGGDTYNITSPFGWRVDPVTGKDNQAHKGADLVLWIGGYGTVCPVCAAWDGTVTAVRDEVDGFDKSRSAGNYVIIDHGNGLVSRYYHLMRGTVKVSPGDTVAAGDQIGYMGSTGYSTGAHLHFQLEANGIPIDPVPFIAGESSPAGDGEEMDNTPNDWAEDAVEWAVQNGIMYGDENGNLRLHEPCTREMMLVFLHRALEGKT